MILDLFVDVLPQIVAADTGTRLLGDPLERVMHERAEPSLVLLGEAEHLADHVDRDVLCVLHRRVDDGVTRGDLTHVVEQCLALRPNLRLPRLDLLRSKRRQQQPAGHVVERWVTADRRGDADRRRQGTVTGATDTDHDRTTGEIVRVVGHFVHQVVGERRPHAAVAIGMSDGTSGLAELLPHLGGRRVVGRVRVVEVGGEVGDRAVIICVVRYPLPDVGALRARPDDELEGLAVAFEADDLVAGLRIDTNGRLVAGGLVDVGGLVDAHVIRCP